MTNLLRISYTEKEPVRYAPSKLVEKEIIINLAHVTFIDTKTKIMYTDYGESYNLTREAMDKLNIAIYWEVFEMRNILFRGKSKETNKFVYGYYVKGLIFEEYGDIIPVYENTVKEYSGCNINNLLIYEGDVLEDKESPNIRGIVRFCNGAFMLETKEGMILLSRALEESDFRVVGYVV